MNIFATRLKIIRERLKEKNSQWTQGYVAIKVGVARSTYTAYENGTKQPPLETVNRIAELLDVSTDYLLGRTDDPYVKESAEEIYDDPNFQHAMRSAQGFSKENKKRVLEYIEMIEELERGRKPGDRQTRPRKR